MAGYRLAVKEAVKYIKSNLVVSADTLGRTNLINAGTMYHIYIFYIYMHFTYTYLYIYYINIIYLYYNIGIPLSQFLSLLFFRISVVSRIR